MGRTENEESQKSIGRKAIMAEWPRAFSKTRPSLEKRDDQKHIRLHIQDSMYVIRTINTKQKYLNVNSMALAPEPWTDEEILEKIDEMDMLTWGEYYSSFRKKVEALFDPADKLEKNVPGMYSQYVVLVFDKHMYTPVAKSQTQDARDFDKIHPENLPELKKDSFRPEKRIPREYEDYLADREHGRRCILRAIVYHALSKDSPYRIRVPEDSCLIIDGHCLSYDVDKRETKLDEARDMEYYYNLMESAKDEEEEDKYFPPNDDVPIELNSDGTVNFAHMFSNKIGEADFAAYHYLQVLQYLGSRFCGDNFKLCVRIFATDTDFLYLSMLYYAKNNFQFDSLEIDLDKEMVLPSRVEGESGTLHVEWTRVRYLMEDLLRDERFGEGFSSEAKIAHFCAGMFMGGGDYLDRYYGVDHTNFMQALLLFGKTHLRSPLISNIENEDSLNFEAYAKLIGCSHALSLRGAINGSKKRKNTNLAKKNEPPLHDPSTLEQETLAAILKQVNTLNVYTDIFGFVERNLASAGDADSKKRKRSTVETMSNTALRKLPPTEKDLSFSFAQFKYYWRMCNALGEKTLPDESDLVSRFEYGLKDPSKGVVYKNVYRKLDNRFA